MTALAYTIVLAVIAACAIVFLVIYRADKKTSELLGAEKQLSLDLRVANEIQKKQSEIIATRKEPGETESDLDKGKF